MLLLLTGCALLNPGPSQKEQCRTATADAVAAWIEVADYFERVAAMKEPALVDAEGAAEQATTRREAAEGSRSVWSKRQEHGLVDARTGEVRRDPVATEQLDQRRQAAGARVEVRTDEEAELLAEALDLRVAYDDLVDKEARARAVGLALEERPIAEASALAVEEARALAQTELAGIAREATDRAVAVCPP